MDVNEYFMRTSLWPCIVYTVLMMIIGTVGNALVMIIYRKDYSKSVTWVFIYYLALLDILSCLITMPIELILLANMMTFPSWTLCKLSRYLSYIFHGSSCTVLMFIAFNRYDRVCRQGSQWLNLTKAKRMCISIFIFASIIDFPSLILYGEAKVPIAIRDESAKIITEEDMYRYIDAKNRTRYQSNDTISNSSVPDIFIGRMCLISSEYSGSTLALIFYFIQFIMYCVLVILVIYFYTKVIRKMVGYRAQQERSFKLYVPNDIVSFRERTNCQSHTSEDEQSNSHCRDTTVDRLSESSPKCKPRKHDTEIGNQTVVAYETKDYQTPSHSPGHGTNSEQGLAGRPEITFPVSGAKNIEMNKLLTRRIESAESLRQTINPIPSLKVPNMDAHQNSNTPLFLHANKTQKKHRSCESHPMVLKRKSSSHEGYLSSKLDTDDYLDWHNGNQLHGYLSKSMDIFSPSIGDPLNFEAKTMTLNRRSSKGSSHCILPISGLSVKTVVSYDGSSASNENLRESILREEECIETTSKTESPNKTEFSRKNDSENNIETLAKDKTPEKNCQSNSANSEKNEPEASGQSPKKFVAQSSVTFSNPEQEDPVRKPSFGRSSRLDSVSSLMGTPAGWRRLSTFRRKRSGSFFSQSPKTMGYNRRMSVRPIKALRTSTMLLSISLAFIFSFLPFWIIVLWRAVVGSGFVPSLTSTGLGAISLFIRSSFVSNAVNPIVYGLINNQFRSRCKAIFKRR